MAATAQDSLAPLRGGDGKAKDEDLEDGAIAACQLNRSMRCSARCAQSHVNTPVSLHLHNGMGYVSRDAEVCGGCAVEFSPFYGIDKGSVLQEARIFHQSQLDPRKCQQVRRSVSISPVYRRA
jgi:hypothetical protein